MISSPTMWRMNQIKVLYQIRNSVKNLIFAVYKAKVWNHILYINYSGYNASSFNYMDMRLSVHKQANQPQVQPV